MVLTDPEAVDDVAAVDRVAAKSGADLGDLHLRAAGVMAYWCPDGGLGRGDSSRITGTDYANTSGT